MRSKNVAAVVASKSNTKGAGSEIASSMGVAVTTSMSSRRLVRRRDCVWDPAGVQLITGNQDAEACLYIGEVPIELAHHRSHSACVVSYCDCAGFSARLPTVRTAMS